MLLLAPLLPKLTERYNFMVCECHRPSHNVRFKNYG